MIKRLLENTLQEALRKNASVALIGPRQVGKTTLALNLASNTQGVYLDLENPLDLSKVEDFAAYYTRHNHQLVILDEIQKKPGLFGEIRGWIDHARSKGNKYGLFLFLGSASMDLLKQSGESLAGRIVYLELYPINLIEYRSSGSADIDQLWLRGGFPESLLADSTVDSLNWRQHFLRTYLERDIPQLGPRIPAETLARFWTMLAYNQGAIFNASQMAQSMGVAHVTISRYLDLMVDLLLVRRLQPWFGNVNKRLIKSPKVYIRDSGLTHALLRIADHDVLLGHPVVGGSWEGFVLENILSLVGHQAVPYYYRTSGGAEIDLILEWSPRDQWAIEIKRNTVPSVSKGFHTGCNDIQPTKKLVVYNGQETFPLKHDLIATGLAGMLDLVQNRLK